MNVVSSFLIESVLLFLLFVSTLCFGSVFPWAFWFLTASLFLLLFLAPPDNSNFSSIPNLSRLCFLALSFGILIQILWTSKMQQATLEEFIQWLAFAGGFLVVQSLTEKSTRRYLLGAALLGFLQASYGCLEVLTGHEQILWRIKENYQGFVSGTYFNRNHFAGCLEILMGLQIGFLAESLACKKYSKSIYWMAILALSFFAFLKSGSRLGMVSFVMAFTGAFFFLRNKITGEWRWAGIFLLVGMGIVYLAGDSLRMRLFDFETWESSSKGRFWVWQGTVAMIRQNPWFGTGLGTYEWIFPAYQPLQSTLAYSHAHQDYLELVASLGLPFAALLFLGFSRLFLDVFKGLTTAGEKSFYLIWGACMGLLSFLLHGWGDFNFAIPANRFLFVIVLAAAFRLSFLSREPRPV